MQRLSAILLSGPTILAGGVLAGLAVPHLASLAAPLLSTMVFIFVFGTFLRADVSLLGKAFWQPWTSMGVPAVLMTFVPAILYLTLSRLQIPEEILLAVLLATLCPPSSGNATLARMVGYVGEFPLTVILVTMLLAPITLPLVVWVVVGVDVSPYLIAKALFVFLLATAGLAALCRLVLREKLAASTYLVDRVILVALFVFAVATMDGVQAEIIQEPARAGLLILLAFAVNITMQVCGFFLVGGSLENRLASALTAGNRNVGLIWATMGSLVSPTVALFFAATQLPIFILPFFIKLLKSTLTKKEIDSSTC